MISKDITYTTNSQLGFDYLRDNIVRHVSNKTIRGLSFAIIDEGDSILIDEGRTPLIISGMPKDESKFYLEADNFVKSLKEEDYIIDSESNTIFLSEEGYENIIFNDKTIEYKSEINPELELINGFSCNKYRWYTWTRDLSV